MPATEHGGPLSARHPGTPGYHYGFKRAAWTLPARYEGAHVYCGRAGRAVSVLAAGRLPRRRFASGR
jgi:hypothetical protein